MDSFVMDSVARVVPGESGEFQHRFGGLAQHSGIMPRGNTQPLHLIYTLDTADPLCPVRIPGVRFLPLYYCFPYNAGAMGYRMVSEDEIRILWMETLKAKEDFPYPDYPQQFPELSVVLLPVSESEQAILARHIENEELTRNRENLSAADQEFLESSGYPFTQLGGVQLMSQGVPYATCANPDCKDYESSEVMDVFAVVWNYPVPGIYLWDEEADDVQIIFQICRECGSVDVCNRCT